MQVDSPSLGELHLCGPVNRDEEKDCGVKVNLDMCVPQRSNSREQWEMEKWRAAVIDLVGFLHGIKSQKLADASGGVVIGHCLIPYRQLMTKCSWLAGNSSKHCKILVVFSSISHQPIRGHRDVRNSLSNSMLLEYTKAEETEMELK